jgi:capsular polysaccharide transport system permease protein
MTQQVRTPWQVTRSVWYALFMREALSRTTADRFGWFWMIIEPAAMIVLMVLIRSVAMGNTHHIAGAEFVPWFVIGLFGFYLHRENMMRLIGSVDANKALFAYRQVKPIDTVLVRSYVETILKTFVFILFILVSELIDISLVPDNLLLVFLVWLGIWLLGLGAGLILSTLSTLFPEVGKIVRIMSFPLLLISGVMFPIHYIPHAFQEILLLNPIVHGIELLRWSFISSYRLVNGISVTYFVFWMFFSLALGLALQRKFESKLKSQ